MEEVTCHKNFINQELQHTDTNRSICGKQTNLEIKTGESRKRKVSTS